ncbi:M20 family metallo-hydrolase [Cryobacterium sp. TMT1-66-1]|uniref:M20 family metallo-hydrolase n=1 Tax=Cryobacterium sp. TMT1-66-1 TaxID=1259242 RepID=UPI00106A5545|nr:M20 family metallo-hydrolase [Cryobacterium sp. TMT1-66-1]TFD07639.1 Zn-dependent hydrolase [Cryobacterium sp. TMT1-66-1]
MIDPSINTDLAGEDFLADFAAMSAFGATDRGGVHRLAASPADADVRTWLRSWLQQRDFTVRVDQVGNMFGLVEFTPGAPYVLVGSHLDSQPTAGRFDGAYGVLAAGHAAVRVRNNVTSTGQTPPFNLAVVNWFNEEGARFQPSMMGSAVFTNKLGADAVLQIRDPDGVSVADALSAIGFRGTDAAPHAVSYAEIHIEQGRHLERNGVTIGLVDATWAAHKYSAVVTGEQSHTGSTVMSDRKDALVGASRLVIALRDLADSFPDPALHTSVGQLFAEPNSPVVVASEVRMVLDLRSASAEVLEQADAMLHEQVIEIERRDSVTITLTKSHFWNVQPYQAEGVTLARAVADDLGLSSQTMMTLAGHDSTNMKDVVPTVMLFVPSVDGISHNEGELTLDADVRAGVDMLTEVVARLCAGRLSPAPQPAATADV